MVEFDGRCSLNAVSAREHMTERFNEVRLSGVNSYTNGSNNSNLRVHRLKM